MHRPVKYNSHKYSTLAKELTMRENKTPTIFAQSTTVYDIHHMSANILHTSRLSTSAVNVPCLQSQNALNLLSIVTS